MANKECCCMMRASFNDTESLNASFVDGGSLMTNFGEVTIRQAGDYDALSNKPAIEGNVLVGDKTFVELGLNVITAQEIDEIIYGG